ncbi:hypothetical protein Pa4123_39190 [Phytohabitans aurantiacus]|uniref:Uncharacterized protein n=1 Tax=Phytohabitans aurantiacus TaxID=3016789 RepID=A0ABQ5QWS0_9ACTN|nr:hypothetical protein Pa4123_39190 [Phytohabitans aurantiacus]
MRDRRVEAGRDSFAFFREYTIGTVVGGLRYYVGDNACHDTIGDLDAIRDAARECAEHPAP